MIEGAAGEDMLDKTRVVVAMLVAVFVGRRRAAATPQMCSGLAAGVVFGGGCRLPAGLPPRMVVVEADQPVVGS